MTAMGDFKKLFSALAVVAVSVSCGDVVRQGSSPVFLVIDQLTAKSGSSSGAVKENTLLSDVITMVTQPAPCSADSPCPTIFNDTGEVVLRTLQKDISAVSPSSNSEVTINRYRVSYRRADGHNTPGVDVPFGFDGAATGTSAGGKLTLTFEIVRHVAKMESPLVELASGRTIITTIADVSFYGRDQVGNDVNVTGSIQIDFGNFGDK